MDRRMAFMTRSLATSLEGKPLHEHFGVHGKYDLRRMNMTTFQLDVVRSNSFVYTFQGIPEDIEHLISSFLHKHIICTLQIHYADVFRPPEFKVIRYASNLYINLEGLICKHNYMYQQDWTLAFTLEKDILYLVCLISAIV